MSTGANGNTPLKWDVFVAKRQGLTRDLPPGKEELMWVPGSATLIYGEKDAVLVDTLLTVEQAKALVEWVAAHGKNVTTIYVTHGHGDHFFGLGAVLDRFPKARAVAMPEVVKVMRRQAAPETVTSFWKARYPGQIPERLVIAEELKGNVIHLEGRELIGVPLGHTDTDNTTCLHVPSVGLVVAGFGARGQIVIQNMPHEWGTQTSTPNRLPLRCDCRRRRNRRAPRPGFRESRHPRHNAGASAPDDDPRTVDSSSGPLVEKHV